MSRSRQRISLWDLYSFAYFLVFRSPSWRYWKEVLRILLEPCNYWRNVEVPAVLSQLRTEPGHRVLDIGSPKLPSLFLWFRMSAEVYATDLLPYFVEECSYFSGRLSNGRNQDTYHIETQDARKLTYPDNFFDRIYAISVLEHIEGNGDSDAVREIARVLKPGAICCLTVPFAKQYDEETINPELYRKFYYGLREQETSSTPTVFWQRKYDSNALRSRLIDASGLIVSVTELYGERWFAFERFYASLPSALRVLLSLPGPLFSRLFLYKVNGPGASNPKTALLVLRKGEGKGRPQENEKTLASS